MTHTHSPKKRLIKLSGLQSEECALRIEKALAKLDTIDLVEVSFESATATITGADAKAVVNTIEAMGFGAQLEQDLSAIEAQEIEELGQLIKRRTSYAIAGILLGLCLWLFGEQITDSFVLRGAGWATLAMMLMSGEHIYKAGFKAIKTLTPNKESAAAVLTSVAWLYSMVGLYLPSIFAEGTHRIYFETCVIVIGLVNVGQVLSMRARLKAYLSAA